MSRKQSARSRYKSLDPLRKVAILISTLDHREADILLEQMPADQAARARNAVMQLDEIPHDLQQQVLEEFMQSEPRWERTNDGVELDESLMRKLEAPEPEEEHSPHRDLGEDAPFRFLHEATTASLVKHLRCENPQVVAVVVAHLPPDRAADLVSQLDPPAQADVLRRVAELDLADLEMVREVEHHLRLLLSDDIRASRHRAAGVSLVASIIDAAGAGRDRLAASLRQHGQELAAMLPAESHPRRLADDEGLLSSAMRRQAAPDQRKGLPREETDQRAARLPEKALTKTPAHDAQATEFADLYQLDDASLVKLLRAAEGQMTLLALAGASPMFVRRLLSQLPTRDAAALRSRMERLGPLRLADIEHAQRCLARLADELAARGEIKLTSTKRFAAAV